MTNKFRYAIAIKPLGLLYASSGGFLSPQNLVGRSNSKFPPDSTTLSGIYAAHYGHKSPELNNLQLAGSFWSYEGQEQDFYVPTPFNYLVKNVPPPINYQVKEGEIQGALVLKDQGWRLPNGKPKPKEKYNDCSWIKLSQWKYLSQITANRPLDEQQQPIKVKLDPWKNLPHLHPRLEEEQRIVAQKAGENQGSLYLENAVQLPPEVCLIYLADLPLPRGWYRFGGEGHLVEIVSHELNAEVDRLLNQPVGNSFALISPGVWGTNRHSRLEPVAQIQEAGKANEVKQVWNVKARISDRPRPFRYRLGKKDKLVASHVPKLLSRGRYAVPAGSVYVLEESLPCWYEWGEGEQEWFPREGYSLKRWGCSLALPLDCG